LRVLITRPEAEARGFARRLEALGYETLVEPMLVLEFVAPDGPPDLAGVQAVLFTSANGVGAFARHSPERRLAVFAVGRATAEAARAAGFAEVRSAEGDAEALVRLVAAKLDPEAGALVHARGEEVARDPARALAERGFQVRSMALYRMRPAASLSPALVRQIEEGAFDVAAFFSPRSAGTFVSLVEKAGLSRLVERIAAVALSRAVAERLRPLPWRRLLVAAEPNQRALIGRIGEAAR
jgi:uroporphyrinogen-III synthase